MAHSKAGLLILFLVRGDSFVRARASRRCSALLPGPSAGQRHNLVSIQWPCARESHSHALVQQKSRPVHLCVFSTESVLRRHSISKWLGFSRLPQENKGWKAAALGCCVSLCRSAQISFTFAFGLLHQNSAKRAVLLSPIHYPVNANAWFAAIGEFHLAPLSRRNSATAGWPRSSAIRSAVFPSFDCACKSAPLASRMLTIPRWPFAAAVRRGE